MFSFFKKESKKQEPKQEPSKFEDIFELMKDKEDEIVEVKLSEEQKETNLRLQIRFQENLGRMKRND